MKLGTFHKIVASLMSVVLLFSTVSLTIEKHFCGGDLVDVAIFTDGKKLCADGHLEFKEMISETSCCKNTVEVLQGVDQLSNQDTEFQNLALDHPAVIFAVSYWLSQQHLPEPKITFRDYKVPLITKDIQVLHEVFLI